MALIKTLAAVAFVYATLTGSAPTPQAPAPATTSDFYLKPCITAGNASLFPSQLYITTQHTGAGTSAAVATTNQSIAAIFSLLNDTYLGFESSGGSEVIPYSFGLEPANAPMSNAPGTYDEVVVDAGYLTSGFALNGNNVVSYTGNSTFTTFALCSVNGTAPYFSEGPDYQLFWKNETSAASAVNCADVELEARYTTS